MELTFFEAVSVSYKKAGRRLRPYGAILLPGLLKLKDLV